MYELSEIAIIALLTTPTVVEFLSKYAIKKGLDGLLSSAKEKIAGSVEYQLIDTLNDSLKKTCKNYGFEYKTEIIVRFISSLEVLDEKDPKKALELVLENAIGQENVNADVISFWRKAWYEEIIENKREKLNNFIKIETGFSLKQNTVNIERKVDDLGGEFGSMKEDIAKIMHKLEIDHELLEAIEHINQGLAEQNKNILDPQFEPEDSNSWQILNAIKHLDEIIDSDKSDIRKIENDDNIYLTEEEKEEVSKFSKMIDLNNASIILQYASGVFRKLALIKENRGDFIIDIDKFNYEKIYDFLLSWNENIIIKMKSITSFPYNISKKKQRIAIQKIWLDAAQLKEKGIEKKFKDETEYLQMIVLKSIARCSKFIENYTNFCKELQMYYLAGEERLLKSSVQNKKFKEKLSDITQLVSKSLWLIERLKFIEEHFIEVYNHLIMLLNIFESCLFDIDTKLKIPDSKIPESIETLHKHLLLLDPLLLKHNELVNNTISEYVLFVANKSMDTW